MITPIEQRVLDAAQALAHHLDRVNVLTPDDSPLGVLLSAATALEHHQHNLERHLHYSGDIDGATIIAAPRQGGKTHELVRWVEGGMELQPGRWTRIIITNTNASAAHLRRTYDLATNQVYGIQHWKTHRPQNRHTATGWNPQIAVDETLAILATHIGQQPDIVSITESIHPRRPRTQRPDATLTPTELEHRLTRRPTVDSPYIVYTPGPNTRP